MPPPAEAPASPPPDPAVHYTLREVRLEGFSKKFWRQKKGSDRYVTVQVDAGDVWSYTPLSLSGGALTWNQPTDYKPFDATAASQVKLTLHKSEANKDTGKVIGTICQPLVSWGLLGHETALEMHVESKRGKRCVTVTLVISNDGEQRETEHGPHSVDRVGEAASNAGEQVNLLDKHKGTHSIAAGQAQEIANSVDFPWQSLLDKVDGFVKVMDVVAEVHPYTKLAWSILSSVHKAYKHQLEQDDAVRNLADSMMQAYTTISNQIELEARTNTSHTSLEDEKRRVCNRHKGTLQSLSILTIECGAFISRYTKEPGLGLGTVKRLLSDTDASIDIFVTAFDHLESAWQTEASANIESMVTGVLLAVDEIQKTFVLQELRDPHQDERGSEQQKRCLKGTQEQPLKDIRDWISGDRDSEARVRLLLGVAGTGKSTIANTIAHEFRYSVRPDGSKPVFSATRFIADRGSMQNTIEGGENRTVHRPQRAIRMIAWQIAQCDPVFELVLYRTLKADPLLTSSRNAEEQFKHLILEPAKYATVTKLNPALIVIDGLDEMGGVIDREVYLDILSTQLYQLPEGFRILLTGRPERDINNFFQSQERHVCIQNLEKTREDVLLFICDVLTTRGRKNDPVFKVFNKTHFEELGRLAEGLFQWARVACDFIIGNGRAGRKPMERYQLLVGGPQNTSHDHKSNLLDDLYQRILPFVVELGDETSMARFKTVMGMVLYALGPGLLNQEDVRHLGEVIDLHSDLANAVLPYLGSFLSGVSEEATPIRPLHTSVRDFLTDKHRAGVFYIGDAAHHHANLAKGCLGILNGSNEEGVKNLRFNMCDLPTSYRLNRDIADLKDRVQQTIKSPLAYACQYWGQHLGQATSHRADSMISDIGAFIEHSYLFWLEALSLLGAVNSAAPSLLFAKSFMKGTPYYDRLVDCLRFVRGLATPISASAPHIYLSALMNAPSASSVEKTYRPCLPYTAQICQGQRQLWPMQNVLRGHTGYVQAVAVSHDSKLIASGSWDCSVRLWDAETGQPMGSPCLGHTDWVLSLSFSPDNARLVSSADDGTIRIWNTTTLKLDVGPFGDGTSAVLCVAFSRDGRRVVSGSGMSSSGNSNVRLWDAGTGALRLTLLPDCASSIMAVAFSPDDGKILSGSSDGTFQVWDATNGQPLGRLWRTATVDEESSTVWAFSPDSKRAASASDGCVHVWDVDTGEPIVQSQGVHKEDIRILAFSLDGKWIVSGSKDATVRLWNAKTGKAIGGLLEGHASSVLSVSVSHDKSRVVSGSSDGTVRIWDVNADEGDENPDDSDGEAGMPSRARKSVDIDEVANTLGYMEEGKPDPAAREGHVGSIYAVAFSYDGKNIVSTTSEDRTVRVWDTETGALIGAPMQFEWPPYTVSFSRNSEWIVAGGGSELVVWAWDGKDGVEMMQIESHQSEVFSVCFSHDSTRIASGFDDGGVKVWTWDGNTVQLDGTLKGHTDAVQAVGFSHDSQRIASGSDDHTIRIWDAHTYVLVGQPCKGHADSVTDVSFSHDNASIVSGSYDREIRIWNAKTGNCDGILTGHDGPVLSVSFSSDDQWVVSGSDDNTVRLWNAKTHTLVHTVLCPHFAHAWSIAVSSNTTKFAFGSSDALIRMYTPEWTKELNPVSPEVDPHPQQQDTSHTGWPPRVTLDRDTGWIMCNENDYLLWLPEDMLSRACIPPCERIFPNEGTVRLDVSQFVHGEDWAKCYQDRSTTSPRQNML